ncbi:MAG: hypothetical protein ABI614_11490 [Planctomycetota bacterium]
MKQTSQSGRVALGSVARAFVAVVMVGLFVATVIYLPNIRASLQQMRLSDQPGSRGAESRTQQNAEVETKLLDGVTGHATAPGVALERPVRQEIVVRIKTVQALPATDSELERAHELARGEACEPIPGGEAREITSFAPYLTQRDYREFGDGKVTALSSRQHIFSVGFDMLASDRNRLPRISGGLITRYLSDQFITLQVRVQKDLVSGVLHLHHRPLAATASFRQRRITQEPTETLARSLQNYRSLGLFLADEMPAIPENLRTLVLLHKSEREASGVGTQSTFKYEFVFVRSLDAQDGSVAKLSCHTFATSDERTRLHYLQASEDPSRPESCSVKTMLYFTEYADHGLRPVASVSRGSIFNDQAAFSMESLNQHAQSEGWEGDALGNLTKTLDAIIGGKIPRQE